MIKILLVSLALIGSLHAGLDLDYFDSTKAKGIVAITPGGPTTKRWIWSRDGVVILKRTITEMSGQRNSSKIEQIICHGDMKIFLSLLIDNHPSEVYYPQASTQLLRSDTDRDEHFDTISLVDSQHELLELYSIDKNGLIVPASDESLKERREFIKKYSEAMKDF